jgi:A/G-specific adenine glycosylase
MHYDEFTAYVTRRGQELFRPMPWRETTDPYLIMVSELMLQQTQVSRVVPKYEAFTAMFPTITALRDATLEQVLQLWQGLGYNRRAKYLLAAARHVSEQYGGAMPSSVVDLQTLPGVGKNTAGAICAYAYDQPVVYVETNIRTVYLHHFFTGKTKVHDKEIERVLALTLPDSGVREFYWALMDYGAWLKANGVRNIDRSSHHRKQPPLRGSIREARGAIITHLTNGAVEINALEAACAQYGERYPIALEQLIQEQMVGIEKNLVRLTNH